MNKQIILLMIFLSLVSTTYSYGSCKVDTSTKNKITSNYKCEYKSGDFYTILSSGDETHISEIWGIDKNYIEHLPEANFNQIDLNNIIKKSSDYLINKYSVTELKLLEIKFERINELDLLNNKNWIVLVTFQYDDRGYTQVVPLLIDGRIILSNNE